MSVVRINLYTATVNHDRMIEGLDVELIENFLDNAPDSSFLTIKDGTETIHVRKGDIVSLSLDTYGEV